MSRPGPTQRRASLQRSGIICAFGVAVACLSCGSAEQVDLVCEPPPAQPQALSTARSCPEFGWWLALPKSLPVGESTFLVVDVSDADTEASRIFLNWSASSGDFSAPHRAETEYTCVSEGLQRLSLGARDDTDCLRTLEVDVGCFLR